MIIAAIDLGYVPKDAWNGEKMLHATGDVVLLASGITGVEYEEDEEEKDDNVLTTTDFLLSDVVIEDAISAIYYGNTKILTEDGRHKVRILRERYNITPLYTYYGSRRRKYNKHKTSGNRRLYKGGEM